MSTQGLSPSIDSGASDLTSGAAVVAPVVPYRGAGARALGVLGPACVAVADGWAMAVAVAALRPVPGAVLPGAAAVAIIVCNAAGGLYRVRRSPSLLADAPRVLVRTAGVGAAVLLLGAVRDAAVAWLWIMVVAGGSALGVRAFVNAAVRTYRFRRSWARPVLVVGTGGTSAQLVGILRDRGEFGLAAVGQVAAGVQGEPVAPLLGETADLPALVERHGVDVLVVVAEDVQPEQLGTVLHVSFGLPCETLLVRPPSDMVPVPTPRREQLAGLTCARVGWGLREPSARFAKRLLDVVVGSLLVLLASPVLVACAVAVRSDGPGVLFRQRRVGLGGKEFVLLKFRTLRPVDESESDTRWTVDGERVGKVGRFLRATSLDELPQLWNVIRGDMSLVGPRPERPHFVEQFSRTCPGYSLRHRVPAGLTGWAQIHGFRGDTSIELRARLDNHYIDHWTFTGDLKILLLTVRAMILRDAG
ncbi:sugar transferase [Actinomadura spongiicola]|uniref:Sugar transferase n=1 Tax=Actinomadura spongiicola TaxID=2303421 RepID=A0A372G9P1_9ACTN|nr:sugar transferase [Actinomadura spongiicola]RFS82081.1 sugar transferase [Actinomadura spongiicola]